MIQEVPGGDRGADGFDGARSMLDLAAAEEQTDGGTEQAPTVEELRQKITLKVDKYNELRQWWISILNAREKPDPAPKNESSAQTSGLPTEQIERMLGSSEKFMRTRLDFNAGRGEFTAGRNQGSVSDLEFEVGLIQAAIDGLSRR